MHTDGTAPVQDFLLSPAEGGRARARKLSAEERAHIARRAAQTRWANDGKTAVFTGTLVIGDTRIDCAVLEDGTRVLAQNTVLRALGRASSMGRRADSEAVKRAPFLSAANLLSLATPDLLERLAPIEYRTPAGHALRGGYRADVLPDICAVYLEARRRKLLQPKQYPAAEAAEILMSSLAKVGITALVDEATGYQQVRARDELQALLGKYVREEFRPWVRVFPNDFFAEVYRLYGWDYKVGKTKHPQYVGTFINEHVYDRLPEGVADELRRVNPKLASGNRARKHHQHLTVDTGIEHLDKQIVAVITLMQVSEDRPEFDRLFARKFPTDTRQKVLRVVNDGDEVQTLFELEDFAGDETS